MSEDNTNGAAAVPELDNQPRLRILAQYIRDLSFENIVAQKGVSGPEVNPEIAVQVSLDARKRTVENQYEVIAKFKIDSKNSVDSSTLFMCELEYAGVFHVENVAEEQLHPFLMIECPRMMFPYIRRVIGDITRDGGFPPLNLDPVDFVALYRQEVQRRMAAQAERPEGQVLS